jgi:hypothetical protein
MSVRVNGVVAACAAVAAFAGCCRSPTSTAPCDAGELGPCPVGSGCTLGDGGPGACCPAASGAPARCTDLGHDPANCGGCGLGCGNGESCAPDLGCFEPDCGGALPDAICRLPDGGAGQCCGGRCGESFGLDCRRCGLACPAGAACVEGLCLVDGDVDYCRSADCPAGTVCEGFIFSHVCAPLACVEGDFCAGDGGVGICCHGGCLASYDDPANCGGCGRACAAGQLCDDGICRALAPPAACTATATGTWCELPDGGPGGCCGGSACVDLLGDPANCDSCGVVCPAGTTCRLGACTTPDGGSAFCCPTVGGCHAAGTEHACPAGTACGPGFRCLASPCGIDGTPCVLGPFLPGTCCGGRCVDTTSDPSNCGACGSSCASGACWRNGICAPPAAPCADCTTQGGCPPGDVCDDGLCVTTSCGVPASTFCALPGGGVGGCCGPSFALLPDGGFVTSAEAFCADLSSDSQNCGACNEACPPGDACVSGFCNHTGVCRGEGYYCDLADGGLGVCLNAEECLLPDGGLELCGNAGAGLVCFLGQCCAPSKLECGGCPCSSDADCQLGRLCCVG